MQLVTYSQNISPNVENTPLGKVVIKFPVNILRKRIIAQVERILLSVIECWGEILLAFHRDTRIELCQIVLVLYLQLIQVFKCGKYSIRKKFYGVVMKMPGKRKAKRGVRFPQRNRTRTSRSEVQCTNHYDFSVHILE